MTWKKEEGVGVGGGPSVIVFPTTVDYVVCEPLKKRDLSRQYFLASQGRDFIIKRRHSLLLISMTSLEENETQ